MDPLSITASAIAVATLAANVCTAFAELRSLCKTLPGRLHALNNEVADLESVLLQVASLIKERACLPDSKQSALPHLITQADAKLNELSALVARLIATCGSHKLPLVGLNAWRKEHDRMQALQDDLKTVKCSLNIVLGASNSYDMMRLRLDVEEISTTYLQSSQDQLAVSSQLVGGMATVDERITRVEEMLRVQTTRLQESQHQQVGPLYNMNVARARRSPRLSRVDPCMDEHCEGLGVRVTPYTVTCRSGCVCACHLQQKSATPTFLSKLIGQVFVGYSGLPVLSPTCNVHACQKSRASQVNLEYWFPLKYVSSTIVRMQFGYQPNLGTMFQLDTLRRVPDSAQCVNFALNGNIDGLKFLFSNGLASPRDVSTTRGYSVLRWALYGKQYKTCKFLMDAGADPNYKPIAASDNNPRNKACHFLLEGNITKMAEEALRAIAKGGYLEDFIDEARFTQTHKIVLGLSLHDLEEEVQLHPEDINVQDVMGRTPLAWAAARGDTRAIVTLLSNYADPNITDVQLSGPVSNAAAQGHTVAVRLLLEAGANPEPRLPDGIRKGSPLNCAARNAADTLLLKTLLDFGADTESSGVDGKTALIHAARTDNSSFAMLLLEYGADINAKSITGTTPLTTAITYNSHNVLQLILDRWHEYSSCPRLKGPHLLQVTAQYADLATLDILAGVEHFRLRYDKDYALGDFQELVRRRADVSEEIETAFDDLLGIISGTPNTYKDFSEKDEPDFVSCPVSRANTDLGNSEARHAATLEKSLAGLQLCAVSERKRSFRDDESDSDSDGAFEDSHEGYALSEKGGAEQPPESLI